MTLRFFSPTIHHVYSWCCLKYQNSHIFIVQRIFRELLCSNLSDFFQTSKASLLKSTVVIQVFDFNRFTKHNIIGELRVQLGSIDWNHVIEEWQDLAEPAKFEVTQQPTCRTYRVLMLTLFPQITSVLYFRLSW